MPKKEKPVPQAKFLTCLPFVVTVLLLLAGAALFVFAGSAALPDAMEIPPSASGDEPLLFDISEEEMEEEIVKPSDQAETYADMFQSPQIPAGFVTAERMNRLERDFTLKRSSAMEPDASRRDPRSHGGRSRSEARDIEASPPNTEPRGADVVNRSLAPGSLVVLPSKRQYFRHELIRLDAWCEAERGAGLEHSDTDQESAGRSLYAVLFKDGQPFRQIAGNFVSPFAERRGRFSAYVNTGWNPPPGKYEARIYTEGYGASDADYYPVAIEVRARMSGASGAADAERSSPETAPREAANADAVSMPVLPRAGLFAMTIEMSIPLRYQRLRLPNGENGDWRAIFEWMRYIGSDTLWILGSQTAGNDRGLSVRLPHNKDTAGNVAFLAPEAKARGYDFGAYIISYYTPHGGTERAGYWPSLGLVGDLRASAHTSLASRKRFVDLVRFARGLQENADVDYIGFDFIRTGEADGFELAEQAADEMNIPVPSAWAAMSRRDRILWFAREQTAVRRPGVVEAWRWWRAHRVASIIGEVIRYAKITKPVWCFTLGWENGHHHGQDPYMFLDAGVRIDAPMLYEADGVQYRAMAQAWRRYTPGAPPFLVMGNSVDAVLNASPDRSSLEEFYLRNILAVDSFLRDAPPLGIFWHDLGRALFGRTGPHEAREWALAGASAAAYMREKHGIWPFRVTLQGQTMILQNTGALPLTFERIALYPDARPELERVYARDLRLAPDETKTVGLGRAPSNSMLRLECEGFPPYIGRPILTIR